MQAMQAMQAMQFSCSSLVHEDQRFTDHGTVKRLDVGILLVHGGGIHTKFARILVPLTSVLVDPPGLSHSATVAFRLIIVPNRPLELELGF